MKKYSGMIMLGSLAGVVLFTLRFELHCWKYSKMYNFIHNMDYWLPVLICFLIFLYFYLKSDHKRR